MEYRHVALPQILDSQEIREISFYGTFGSTRRKEADIT